MSYEFFITMGAAAILASIKNEQSKAQFKKVMLKIYKGIKAAYATDPDFQ